MIDNYLSLFERLEFWKDIKNTDSSLNYASLGSISAKAFFISAILSVVKKPILWLVEDPSQILEISSNLKLWNSVQIKPLVEDSSNVELASVLSLIHRDIPSIVILSTDNIEKINIINKSQLERRSYILEKDKKNKLIDFFEKLIALGYQAEVGSIEKEGTYLRRGGIVDIFPVGEINPIRVELFGDNIQTITNFDLKTGKPIAEIDSIKLWPIDVVGKEKLYDYFQDGFVIFDEIEIEDYSKKIVNSRIINLYPFLGEETNDCSFSSLLKYNSPLGFIGDLKNKIDENWEVIIFSKDKSNISKLLASNDIRSKKIRILEQIKDRDNLSKKGNIDSLGFEIFPEGFLNHVLKFELITDREIFNESSGKHRSKKMEVDAAFLANLHINDYVVHFDHGIGKFNGIQKKEISGIIKEYLFIEYANNDKLFIPVDQADKVNKYIGADGVAPRLTRLGSAEWDSVVKKGREETLKIAEELLLLFAERDQAKGFKYKADNEFQAKFEKEFPYVPTDGQIEAIMEVKKDMESERPMDRLVCGDVGFGKTEVAMRAAFKAVQNGKQVAFLTPITILADQHFRTLKRRMKDFAINIEMISRFRSKSEINDVLVGLRSGKIDIVVGTHMLLQEKVHFKDLGLVIVDEEQRFGVKQKEKLKELRVQIDILTLTATPIPRTLNMSLAGIRDISTITTPPPGRLPIHTEVRRFSLNLIREVILREIGRDGQVYFLHNRVQTIESIAEKLRILVPEAKFVVAHGQMSSNELENRILKFKNGVYNVLISSTIIENGIDLENANTLIVDQAETLGLAQAYQLRGRVGRSKRQAYAYFLYHAQKLRDDAKKRLRAIIEASELGSGFQIAMRDLEIRGAGEILGAKQHGTLNSIGVSHFCRLLAKAVEDLRLGRTKVDASEITPDTKIELSISAYLPDEFIPKSMEKIRYYQRLSGVDNNEDLDILEKEIVDKYGVLPIEAINLIKIISLKLLAKDRGVYGIREVFNQGRDLVEIFLGKKVKPRAIMSLLSYNDKWRIIESKMIIDKTKLGHDWFTEMRNCLDKLKE